MEEGPQQIIDGQGDVEMEHLKQVAGNIIHPIVNPDFAAGGTEARFAGKRNAQVVLTPWTDIAGVTGVGVTTEQHALDDSADVQT